MKVSRCDLAVTRDEETGQVLVHVGARKIRLSAQSARILAARLLVASDGDAEGMVQDCKGGIDAASTVMDGLKKLGRFLGK